MTADGLPPLTLEIAAAPEYAIGLPMHVWIVAGLDRKHAELSDLPAVTPFSAGGLGIMLAHAESGDIVWRAEPPPVDPEEPYDRYTLVGPQRRRMLADLFPLLPARLPAGQYCLTVLYRGPLHEVESAPVTVALRAPTEAEAQELERLAPELRRARSWGAWALLQPREPLEGEIAADDPLRFNRLMRVLFYGPSPLAEEDLARVDVLGDFYVAEAMVLRAELLHVLGDVAAFHRAAAEVVERYPDLAWRVAAIAGGGSLIAWNRRFRDERDHQ
jgi:hypothetical protein